jgi:hypothetical protein
MTLKLSIVFALFSVTSDHILSNAVKILIFTVLIKITLKSTNNKRSGPTNIIKKLNNLSARKDGLHYILFSYRLTTVVCGSVLLAPTQKRLEQDVQTQRRSFLKHFAKGTSRNLPFPVASQWPQIHQTHRNWTQHLSDSTHTVTKRSFQPTAGNDEVSRNITIVLENLLKDYESSQLPTHGEGNNFLFIFSF